MRRLNNWIIGAIVALMSVGASSCADDEVFNQREQEKSTVSSSSDELPPSEKNDDDDNGNNDEGDNDDKNDNGDNTGTPFTGFAYGCDPSWVTEMEDKGAKFYDKDGNETECFQLLKNVGFNAARFRVWVDPMSECGYSTENKLTKAYCDKADVIVKAKRAAALGYAIMIDFHYSDNWADPGKQRRPAAWDAFTTLDEIKDAVYAHTKDVLQALKDENVNVTWVQIGNETTNGMIQHKASLSTTVTDATPACGMNAKEIKNYVEVHNKAQEAVKEVYPSALTVIHFDRGHNWSKIQWGVENIVKEGAKFDIFGVSCYPVVTTKDWYSIYVDAFITNMNQIAEITGKDVMICETGSVNIGSYDAKRAMWNTVIRAKNEVSRCKGVFYWEPQAAGFNGYDKGGFLAGNKPSEALDVFSGKYNELLPKEDPNAIDMTQDRLYLDVAGEHIGMLDKESDGVYSGTITFPKTSWDGCDFNVVNNKGQKYGTKGWGDLQFTVQPANSTYNHFWHNMGTYKVTFNLNEGIWSAVAN